MSSGARRLRATSLAIFIGLGVCVQSHGAKAADYEVLTVAGGCFWCVESDFESVKGVKDAVSGYTGGTTDAPTYKQVSRGGTGHYEAVQITYDPDQVTRDRLLHLFFRSVDPTDGGGQFCDRGESYRTAVFFASEAERISAVTAKDNAEADLGTEIVTPLLPAVAFFPAEKYHQDYYKGEKLVITRFGPKRQSEAYKRYRQACGRDNRVRALWGEDAPFAKTH